MRSSRKVFVASVVAFAMFGMMQPANAQSIITIVFTGKAKLNAPIAYPTLGINKGATIPFTMWAGKKAKVGDPTPSVCIGFKVGTPMKQTSANTPKPNGFFNCGINAQGNVRPGPTGLGPWCGHSSGIFGATGFGIDTLTASRQNITISNGSYVSAGSVLVVTADASSGQQTGPATAVVFAIPNPVKGGGPVGNSSCTGGGATNFLVGGIIEIHKIFGGLKKG